MRAQITRLYLFTLFVISSSFTYGNSPTSIFDLFTGSEVLEAKLILDFENIESHRRSDEQFPAVFTFTNEHMPVQNWEIKVNVRGNYRRIHCDLPPLKIKFDKDALESLGLQRHNSFKLVTHCKDDYNAEQILLKEYLAYKIYETLTPDSYRTQLLKLTYEDAKTGESFTQFAFLLEDKDQLEDRLRAKECEDCYNLDIALFTSSNYHLNALFQYMIGNTDWSLSKLRNTKIFQSETNNSYVAVPYDFDFSGFVSAPYASVDSKYPISTVRERLYLGEGTSSKDFNKMVSHYIYKKQSVINLILEFEHLRRKNKKEVLQYILSFYDALEEGSYRESNL